MLVLTRKQSETIQIGDSITITVLRMKGKAVRIGIQAPHDYNVIRGELAFESGEEKSSNESADEVEELETAIKPKSRNRTFGNGTWSPQSPSTPSKQPVEANAIAANSSCAAGAWSI
jgi:carbon storage regulator